jgi:hypothetical protein
MNIVVLYRGYINCESWSMSESKSGRLSESWNKRKISVWDSIESFSRSKEKRTGSS